MAGIIGGQGGGGGGALQQVFTARATPAEDVIDALARLNRALAGAASLGWSVSLSVDEADTSTSGPFIERRPHQVVKATVTKQV